MTSRMLDNIESGNESAKPLPEPMLTNMYCKLDPQEQISVQFEAKYKHFNGRKGNLKCRLRNVDNRVLASMCKGKALGTENWGADKSGLVYKTTRCRESDRLCWSLPYLAHPTIGAQVYALYVVVISSLGFVSV